MNVKSDGGSREHQHTTKLITIPYVPNAKSREEAHMSERKENFLLGVS